MYPHGSITRFPSGLFASESPVIPPQPRIAPSMAKFRKAEASLSSIPKRERIRGKFSGQLFRPHGFRELGGLASPHLHVIGRPRFLRGGA